MPKLRIEECARRGARRASTAARTSIVGVNKYQARAARSRDRRARHRQQRRCASRRSQRLARDAREARRGAVEARARDARASSRAAGRATCSRRRSTRRARARRSARSRRRSRRSTARHRAEIALGLGGVRAASTEGDEEFEAVRARGRGVRRSGGPAAAHAGREARPGRPRPRHEGDRHAPSPTSASTSTSARSSRRPKRRRARRSRTTCTWSASRARRAGHKTLVPAARRGAARAGRRRRRRGRRAASSRRRTTPSCASTASAAIFGPGTPVPKAAREVLARDPRAQRGDDARRVTPAACVASGATACARATGARSRKTITLLESTRADHSALGQAVLDALVPHTGGAIRVGITGPAGRRQEHLHRGARPAPRSRAGKRVAVLAVDPSSPVTRRQHPRRQDAHGAARAVHERAFIRPSPSGGSLGGVAHRTREAMLRAARPRASTWCSSRPSASARPRSPCARWSTSSRCCSSRARATSCRASRRACSSSPTRWS